MDKEPSEGKLSKRESSDPTLVTIDRDDESPAPKPAHNELADLDTAHGPVVISDSWEILEEIGRGGMSVVYKARHRMMKKLVAAKVLRPHLTDKPVVLQRFKQEAQAASKLHHPNIVAVQDCGVSVQGHAFIIMDLVDGGSLSDLIKETGSLPPERALNIFHQICDALNHAHQKGIIHRDLKPSNVVILTDRDIPDIVRIVDFGIAKIMTEEESGDVTTQGLTKTGEVFGSPLYMSPEQCRGQKLDGRSDVYSMGCLMYQTLTGRPPLSGGNPLETIYRQMSDAPEPIVAGNQPEGLLKRLNSIIMRCLAKDPADRYQSMALIKEDLELALTGSRKDWQEVARSLEKQGKLREKKPIPLIAVAAIAALASIAVLIVVVACLLALFFWNDSPLYNKYTNYARHTIWAWTDPDPLTTPAFLKQSAAAEQERIRLTAIHGNPLHKAVPVNGEVGKLQALYPTMRPGVAGSLQIARTHFARGLANRYLGYHGPAELELLQADEYFSKYLEELPSTVPAKGQTLVRHFVGSLEKDLSDAQWEQEHWLASLQSKWKAAWKLLY